MTMEDICVAQVISNLKTGGAQKLLCVMAENQAHAGIKTKIAVLDGPSDTHYHADLNAAGADVVYFPGSGLGSVKQVKQLSAWFHRQGILLAHAHMQRSNIIAPLAAKIAGIPAICGLHVPDTGAANSAKWRRTSESIVMKRAASRVIACSASVALSNTQRLSPRTIDVVTNPVPYVGLPPHQETKKSIGGQTSFLVVGRLAPEKAIDTVLIAAKTLSEQRADFTVTLAGDGACRAELEQQCRDLGLEDRVVFLGTIADVAAVYRSHDVYLSASRAEGLSIALLEAMAHGLPIIATPAGDSAQLVTPETGYEPAQNDIGGLVQAMNDMIDTPEQRRLMGQNARKLIVDNYSPQAWAADMGRHYRAVLM